MRADIAIGAPYQNVSGSNTGKVFIYYGRGDLFIDNIADQVNAKYKLQGVLNCTVNRKIFVLYFCVTIGPVLLIIVFAPSSGMGY